MGNPTIHGWRVYNVGRCNKHQRTTLVGLQGMHVHTKESPEAKCTGFLSYADHVTDEQRQRHEEGKIPKHTAGAELDCTCGYYFHRLYPRASGQSVVAHVTAIGKVAIHSEGGRMLKYRIDFLCAPKINAAVWTTAELDKMGYPEGWHVEKVVDIVDRIAEELGVPVLDPETDENACRICQLANGWREDGREELDR